MIYTERFTHKLGEAFSSEILYFIRHYVSEHKSYYSEAEFAALANSNQFSYRWALNLDQGYHTVTIDHEAFGVMGIAFEIPYPWATNEGEDFTRMAEVVKHHVADRPEVRRATAAVDIVTVLKALGISYYTDQSKALERINVYNVVKPTADWLAPIETNGEV